MWRRRALAMMAVLTACSSSQFEATDGGSPGDGGDASIPGDAGSARDGAADATGDASARDAATGHVDCFGATCAVPAQICCVGSDGGGGCVDRPGTCTNATGQFACDDTTDCTGGAVCCVTWSAAKDQFASQCAPTCPITDNTAIACDKSAFTSQCDAGEICGARNDFIVPITICQ